MKTTKHGILFAAALVGVAWATPTFAQDRDRIRDNIKDQIRDRVQLQDQTYTADTVVNPYFMPGESLVERAMRDFDNLPADVQEDVVALRDSLEALAAAWLADYRPGDDATYEEILAAREAFATDFADDIEANRDLRRELAREIREGLRNRAGNGSDQSGWTEEARALHQQYVQNKERLTVAWRNVVAGLGEGATSEDIAAAKERFREENAEQIAAQKELALSVRAMIRANRPQDRPIVDREPLTLELQELRNQLYVLREQVRERKRQAQDDMTGMTGDERGQYREALLDDLKDIHDEIKVRRREAIDDLRGGQDGDRRPEG